MATLISKATGNFTAAGTWNLVDSTSYLDSEAGSTALTGSMVYSSTFTPGAITIDGVAIKMAAVSFAVDRVISLELNNSTDNAVVVTATCNGSDLGNSAAGVTYNRGWYFFKFGSNQTLIAGKAYKIGLKVASVTSFTITPYRDVTAGNWSRMLRTTTTQAPASGDQLHILGELTGPGTSNSFTVTMNNTTTTSFGPTVSGGPPQGITLGKRATFTWENNASTNYYLKWKGVFATFDGGTLNVGSSGTPILSSSTAVLEMDSVANVDSGMEFYTGATVNIYGAANFTTSFKTLMTVDKAAAATILTVGDTTGWAANDVLAIAATNRTATECENKTIQSVDSSTQITLTAGLTYAHSGTSPTQAEVINITRNVKIRGISSSLNGYFANLNNATTVNIQQVEFSNLGSSTANKTGVLLNLGALNVANIQYCSFHDFTFGTATGAIGLSVTGTASSGLTVSHCSFYNMFLGCVVTVATSGTSCSYNDLIGILTIGTGASTTTNMFTFFDVGGTITNITAVGLNLNGGTAINISEGNATIGTISNLSAHSCSGSTSTIGIICALSAPYSVSNITAWRNSGYGLDINSGGVNFDTVSVFGNATGGMLFNLAASFVTLSNLIANGDTTFAQAVGIKFSISNQSMGLFNISIENSTLGVASGILTTHATADILIPGGGVAFGGCFAVLRNCLLSSATPVSIIAMSSIGTTWLGSMKHQQVAGSYKTYANEGVITNDTVIYNTASPSARLTPNSATKKLQSSPAGWGFFVPVNNGQALTVLANVRKSGRIVNTVNSAGNTTVTLVSGPNFNTSWTGTVTINGVSKTITGAVTSTSLTVTTNMGTLTNVTLAATGTTPTDNDSAAYNGNQPRLIVRRNYTLGITSDTVLDTATANNNGTWELMSGTTAAVTDDGTLEFFVDCDGTTGWINIDDFNGDGLKYWNDGLPTTFPAGGGFFIQ